MFRMAIVPDQRHFPRLSTPNHRISTGGFRLTPSPGPFKNQRERWWPSGHLQLRFMHVMAVLVEHLHERDPAAEADHHPTGEGVGRRIRGNGRTRYGGEPRTPSPRSGRVLRCRHPADSQVTGSPQHAVGGSPSRGVSGGNAPQTAPGTLTIITQRPRSRFGGRGNPPTICNAPADTSSHNKTQTGGPDLNIRNVAEITCVSHPRSVAVISGETAGPTLVRVGL